MILTISKMNNTLRNLFKDKVHDGLLYFNINDKYDFLTLTCV